MKVAIVGTGYVGLVTGTCLAELGVDVTCIDIDTKKIEGLRQGIVPIFEPGLDDMVIGNMQAGRLHFGTDLTRVVNDVDIIFAAVGTPPQEDGSADLQYVLEVVRTIASHMNRYLLVVIKSTVPVGTTYRVKELISSILCERGVAVDFDVASNPEFLKEGDAIEDFNHPDRIVVGVESEQARTMMETLYRPFKVNGHPIIYMDIPSAEMTKYAANAMLATRISFMNDIANLCDLTGADVNMVRKGIAMDDRIGAKFLNAGSGYGGSCFPKDIKALIRTGLENNYALRVLQAVDAVNDDQKTVAFRKLNRYFNGRLEDKTIAVWGLSYKPQTNDMREAPSVEVIRLLLGAGCRIKAYDPVARDDARLLLGDSIYYAEDIYDAAEGADAILLMTEWKEFRLPNWDKVRKIMRIPLVVDGRNIYDCAQMRADGFIHIGIGTR